ncbi:MAG: hypothetical protein OIF58_17200 [Cohaesibacter sp.]|nr:hypothetical protein [Cohaesibacter sp.]
MIMILHLPRIRAASRLMRFYSTKLLLKCDSKGIFGQRAPWSL